MEFFASVVAGMPVVSGLEWRTLTGLSSSSKEIRENAADIGASYFVRAQSATGVTVGFLPDERRADLPKKARSLAALLAGVPGISSDCVLVIQDQDVALMVALREGMPAPGFDGYGAADEVLQAAREFIRVSPNPVAVYGNCEALQTTALSLDDIVSRSTAAKSARIRAMPRPWLAVVVIVGVLAAAGVVGKYAVEFQAAQKKLDEIRNAYVNIDEVYASSVKELFKTMTPAIPAVAQIAQMLEAVPVASGGWALSEVVCQKDGCSYVWKSVFGTNKTFTPPADALNVTFSNKGDVIVYQKAYRTPLLAGLDASSSPTPAQILRDISGDLQEFREVSVEQELLPPTTVFGVPPGLPHAPAHPYKEGAFTLKGPWYAVDAVQKLPDTAVLDTLRISIDEAHNISFNLTGKYYVK